MPITIHNIGARFVESIDPASTWSARDLADLQDLFISMAGAAGLDCHVSCAPDPTTTIPIVLTIASDTKQENVAILILSVSGPSGALALHVQTMRTPS